MESVWDYPRPPRLEAIPQRLEVVFGGETIAATTDGTCSACHMRLQPMLFQKLIHGEEFGQCPSCNRILYFRPGQPAEEERSGGGA